MKYETLTNMISYLEKNIATPYIKSIPGGDKPLEIGYCIVDDMNIVKSKKAIDIKYADIDFRVKGLKATVTVDGYIRLYHNNPNNYIIWEEDNELECMVLVSKQRD